MQGFGAAVAAAAPGSRWLGAVASASSASEARSQRGSTLGGRGQRSDGDDQERQRSQRPTEEKDVGSRAAAGPKDAIAKQVKLLKSMADKYKRDPFADAALPSPAAQQGSKFKMPVGAAKTSGMMQAGKKASTMKGLRNPDHPERQDAGGALARASFAVGGSRGPLRQGASTAREARMADRKKLMARSEQEKEIWHILEQVKKEGTNDPEFVRFVREVEAQVMLLWKDICMQDEHTCTVENFRSAIKKGGVLLGNELDLKLDTMLQADEEVMDKERFIEIFVQLCVHVQGNPGLAKMIENRQASIGASWEAARADAQAERASLVSANFLSVLSNVRRRASLQDGGQSNEERQQALARNVVKRMRRASQDVQTSQATGRRASPDEQISQATGRRASQDVSQIPHFAGRRASQDVSQMPPQTRRGSTFAPRNGSKE